MKKKPKATKGQRPSVARPAASFVSARAMAAALGLTHTAVNKWLRDDRWPFARKGPWPAAALPKMRAWARNTLAEDPAAQETERRRDGETEFEQVDLQKLGHERRAKLALTVEKAKRAKLEREIREGQYHRVDECQRRILLKIHAVKLALATLHEQLPQDVPAATRLWVKSRAEGICNEFAGAGGAA